MFRRYLLTFFLFLMAGVFCFGQAGALRDYVGLLSIQYHPDVIAYMGKFKETFERRGYTNASKAVDNYLKGLSGSGFIYVAPDKTCYILTNEHVVAQSETLSITFEKQDGSKSVYERLKVLYVDEEKDLALLVFSDGIAPFTQGLSFSTRPAEEGGDVFAAGFPGIGNTAIWQFSRGTVSNAIARIPKSSDSDETIGPLIQHTAQIDPGNSGGPLLVAAQGVPTGYAVAGINTYSALWRQAANYAIPIDQVQTFINAALSKDPVNEQDLIGKRIDSFLSGLKGNKAVYEHIASYLSNACTASNAEYAISEVLDKAPRSVQEDIFLNIFAHDPVEGMGAAVAWNIENSMRTRSGGIAVTLDSITANYKGGFDVVFNVNGASVKSEWVKEYGIYRIDTFGDTITGDKTILDEKNKKKEQSKALVTDFSFALTAGYAYVLDYDSAIYAQLLLMSPLSYGFELIYGLRNKEYFQLGMTIGYNHAIRLETVGIIPFGEIGMSYLSTKESKAISWGFEFAMGITLKGGVMVTTSAVSGLFGRVFYQHTIPVFDDNKIIKSHGMIGIGVGYMF